MGYVYIEIVNPFLFTLSESLSHNHRDCLQCYNTIHSHITVFFFSRGNTVGKYYMAPNTMGLQTVGQQTSQKFLSGASPLNPHTPQLGCMLNKAGVQTLLNNNIFEFGISGSRTNRKCRRHYYMGLVQSIWSSYCERSI